MFNEKKEGEEAGGWALSRLALGDSRPQSRRGNSTLLAAKTGPCASTHCPDPVCFHTPSAPDSHCTKPLLSQAPIFPAPHCCRTPIPNLLLSNLQPHQGSRPWLPWYPLPQPPIDPPFIWKQGSCCSESSADLQDICVPKGCLAAPLLAFLAGNLEKWVSAA